MGKDKYLLPKSNPEHKNETRMAHFLRSLEAQYNIFNATNEHFSRQPIPEKIFMQIWNIVGYCNGRGYNRLLGRAQREGYVSLIERENGSLERFIQLTPKGTEFNEKWGANLSRHYGFNQGN